MLAVLATPFLECFEGLFLVLSIWQAQVKDDIFMSQNYTECYIQNICTENSDTLKRQLVQANAAFLWTDTTVSFQCWTLLFQLLF